MLLKVWLSTGVVGGDYADELTVPDEATEEECEEAAREWAFDKIEWGYERAK